MKLPKRGLPRGVLAGAGEHGDAEAHVGARVGDEGLLPVEHPPAGYPLGPGPQRPDVRARPRLGQPEGAELAALPPAAAATARAARRRRTAAAGGCRWWSAPARPPRPTGPPSPGPRAGPRSPPWMEPMPPHFSGTSVPSSPSSPRPRSSSVGQRSSCHARAATGCDLALGVGAAQVKQFAFELGECEVHGPLALPSYTDWSVHNRNSSGGHRNEQTWRDSMTGRDDAAAVRLEPDRTGSNIVLE